MAPRPSRALRKKSLTVIYGRSAVQPAVEAISGAAPYGRVSTDIQREAESIKIQQIKLENSIRVRENSDFPLKDQLHLVETFYDEGYSGTIPLEERPAGRRLVSAICSRASIECDGSCFTRGEINQVWITKLDRLARRLQILINIEAFLRKHHVALVCMDPSLDTSTESGRLVFNVIASIAEWERGMILERTIDGKHQKATEGKWVGGRKAYGLVTDDNGNLQLDTTFDEQLNMMRYEVVQTVFENIALHGSTAWREALRIGMSDRRVNWMLHNVRYKGEGGIIGKDGTWTGAERNPPPQVVTPELWEMAQQALVDNRKNSSRNRHYDYLLSGLLICHQPFDDGICGRVFTGRTEARHKYKTEYTYYYCSRSIKMPNSPSQMGCTAKMVRAKDAEDAVWAEVKAAVQNPHAYLDALDKDGHRAQLLTQLQAELGQVVNQIQRKQTEREYVLRSGESGVRPYDEAQARAREILTDVDTLEQRQVAIKLQLRSMSLDELDKQRNAITVADIASKLDKIEATNDRKSKAALIQALVKSAEVRTVNNRPVIRLVLRLGTQIDLSAAPIASQSGQQLQENREVVEVLTEIALAPRRAGRYTA